MSDSDDTRRDLPADVTAELERLGEEKATEEELLAARQFAAQLEGGLHLVDAGEVPSDAGEVPSVDRLASMARALRTGSGDTTRVGEAVTGRVLSELFDSPASRDQDGADIDAPADDLVKRRAATLGDEVDRLVAGIAPSARLTGEVAELATLAAVIRASNRAQSLSPTRLETLVDEAMGAPMAATTPRVGYRGSRVLGVVSLVAVLVASIVGLVLMVGGPTHRSSRIADRFTSRSTRDILPTAFPRSQNASERIDLIYQDRLRAYREVQLGGPGTGGLRSSRGTRPTPAFIGWLGGGR